MAAPGTNDPAPAAEQALPEEPSQRKGVIGWVKGKIQNRNIKSIDLDQVEANAIAAAQGGGGTSDLDMVTGLGEAEGDDKPIAEDEKIDMEAENDEGLLVGWGKKLQEFEVVKKAVTAVQDTQAQRREAEELREIHEQYKEEIKNDPDIKALQKKIKKIKKNLKVQRLNGDRIQKRHFFERQKEQKTLDANTARLQKAIWTFSNSSMNSHEYAKAMMRASARLARKGFKVHKSEKALAMEAAVLRNMHRMLAVQKQYTMSKRACTDVESFIKRCKGWLDNKLADGEMCIMVLEATAKSMGIMYLETVEVQDAIMPKFLDPENHTFKKERLKNVLALPKGLRSMPTFLKGPSRPTMKISLRKKIEDEDPNLRGYKTFKEQTKAMEAAWEEEMKQYENQLLVGGADTKIVDDDDVSELGDSEDEIEENLAAVSMAAAAAKKAQPHVDLGEMVMAQQGEGAEKKEGEEEGAEKKEGEEAAPAETTEEADAAALEKAAGDEVDKDPEVDEGALPEDVKQEDLDNLLNKEAEEAPEAEASGHDEIEEGLHQVVEDAMAVDPEAGASDEEDEAEAEENEAGEESTKVSCP